MKIIVYKNFGFQFSSRYVNGQFFCFVFVDHSLVSIYHNALCVMISLISQNFYCLYSGNAKQMELLRICGKRGYLLVYFNVLMEMMF